MRSRSEPVPADLPLTDLHGSLHDPAIASMNLLNEIAGQYPRAVSLAAGRPTEEFFADDAVQRWLDRYRRHLVTELGYSPQQVRRTLFQYGRTKGIVHDLVARHLAVDEGMRVDPEAVVVTVGCQEAMVLVLRALRRDARDALLVVQPSYVGITGAALLVDMAVWPVASGAAGIDLDDLAIQLRRVRRAGLRPRACYLVPDFANPTGLRLPLSLRHQLLALADREGLLLIEDNAYGLFDDGDPADGRLPTLKALDTTGRVVYLGSFAKTIMPGARVGYVVADQPVVGADGRCVRFADALSQLKSMLTINTSPLAQAVVGGMLLAHGCSLRRANRRQRARYRDHRARLRRGLRTRLGDQPGVSWNAPGGGFFTVVTVPFEIDDEMLERSAREYGVLWTPMRHFYRGGGGERQLRLSCSALTPAQLETGLDRLSAFIRDHCPG